MELYGALLSPSSKNKKKTPWKNLSSFLKKCFSYISGNRTFLYSVKKASLIFPKMELSSLKHKKFQGGTSELEKIKKAHLEKTSYISGNGNF